MKKKFDSIMRLSNKGYIDNPKDVKEITDAMMSCTLEDLALPSCNIMPISTRLLEIFYLPSAVAEEVRFGELLNLFRVYCLEVNSAEMAAQLVPILIKLSQTIGKVRLFTAIPIKSLMNYIANMALSPLPGQVYNRICGKCARHLGFNLPDDATIGDFLDRINVRMTRWTPGTSLDGFVDYAQNCCEIVKMMLIDCLRIGYIDMFKLSKLNDRLGKLAEEQGALSRTELHRLNRQFSAEFNTKYDYTTDDKIFDSSDFEEFSDEDDFDPDDLDD